IADHLEMVAELTITLGPLVVFRRQRVEVELEPIAIMMLDGRPHHLAHHLISKVARKIADAQAPRAPNLPRLQRLTIDALRYRVVRAIEPELGFWLDIEVEKQKQQLLEAVGEVGLVLRLALVLSQPVEIAVQPGEVAAILINLERLHGERERVRTVRLESLEDS